MKNIFILLILFSSFNPELYSQKHPPETVKVEFINKYPAAESVLWGKGTAGEWEAQFNLNGLDASASFNSKGTWLQTETITEEKDLPEAVKNTISNEFKGFKIRESSMIENPQIKSYLLTLKKGAQSIEVVLNPLGKVIKRSDKNIIE